MTDFAIITPFSLNWKYVVPYDYERLEFFITPRVSILFHEITNGVNDFNLGSFLSSGDKGRFNNELFPQRSKGRIDMSFTSEEVSAFLTKEDADICEELFAKEKFFCHRLSVLLDGVPVDLRTLPEEEFNEAIEILAALKVVTVMDFEEHVGDISEMVSETRKLVEEGIRKETARLGRNKMSNKTAGIKGALGTAAMTLGVACAIGAKKMVKKGGLLGFAAASVCTVLSFGLGLVGRDLTGNTIKHFGQGMVNFGV